MSVPTWKTREGQVIPIAEMTDSHLRNTIAFLRRRAESMRLESIAEMEAYMDSEPPDGAACCCASTIEEVLEAEPDEVIDNCVPEWQDLIDEARRRGFEPQADTEEWESPC